MGINMIDMKQSNVHTVLWRLCSHGTSTIKDLAQITGLSYATVGNILNALAEKNEVLLGDPVSSTGGRPSQTYTFNAEYAHVLALSARVLNGKHIIHACIGNLYGETVWQTEQSFDTIRLTSFEDMVDTCMQVYPTIRILSCSLPGVEHDGTIVYNDYKELEGISFTSHFQEKYHLFIIVENDVNAAVFGYGRRKEADAVIVGIYFPRYFNPGAGILIDRKILKGANGCAGEVALLPLGIDWLAINYENPQEIGPAITKLISIICGTLNPDHVVLYGDFFSAVLQDAIWQAISTQAIKNIFPAIKYQSDFESDIISGLIAQAVSAYQQGACGK